MELQEVQVQALAPERLAPLIGPERMERFHKFAQSARDMLSGRVGRQRQLHATGGGVAEMLRTLLAYARGGVGVDARWVVINGDPTSSPSRSASTTASTGSRRRRPARNGGARALRGRPARQCRRAARGGASARHRLASRPADRRPRRRPCASRRHVVWRCHVGSDTRERPRRGSVGVPPAVPRATSTRTCSHERQFAPPWARRRARSFVIPPSIDPFATKNQAMDARSRSMPLLQLRRSARR